MKIFCSITSYPIHLGGFDLVKSNKSQPHPIFLLSKDELIKNKGNFSTPKEKALFLIALLNSYPHLVILEGLVDYKQVTPKQLEAIPTIIRHFPRFSKLQTSGYDLPKLRLDSKSLLTINNYIKILFETITTREREAISRREQRKEKAANKILSSASSNLDKTLTKWLFQTLEFDHTRITGANRKTKKGKIFDYLDNYYSYMFSQLVKNSANAFNFPLADIDELYDFILENLENDNNNSLLVFKVLNKAIKEVTDLTIDFNSLIGEQEANNNTTSNNTNTDKYKGANKPIADNYTERTSYLIDLARWRLANNEK